MRGIFWKPGRKPQLSTFRPSVVDNPSFVRSRGVGFSQRLDGRSINLRTAQRPHVRLNVGDHGTGRQVLRERVRIHGGVKAAPRETASVEQASRRGSQDIKEDSLCGVQLACILELIDRTNHAICIDRELGMNAIKLLQNRAWGCHKGPRADSAGSADLVVAMNALADFAHINRRRYGEHLPGDVAQAIAIGDPLFVPKPIGAQELDLYAVIEEAADRFVFDICVPSRTKFSGNLLDVGCTGCLCLTAGARRRRQHRDQRVPRLAGAVTSQFVPARSGPNRGGGMRRFDAASYADATRRIRSSAPGSARKTSENGRPGAGSIVGVSVLTGL